MFTRDQVRDNRSPGVCLCKGQDGEDRMRSRSKSCTFVVDEVQECQCRNCQPQRFPAPRFAIAISLMIGGGFGWSMLRITPYRWDFCPWVSERLMSLCQVFEETSLPRLYSYRISSLYDYQISRTSLLLESLAYKPWCRIAVFRLMEYAVA